MHGAAKCQLENYEWNQYKKAMAPTESRPNLGRFPSPVAHALAIQIGFTKAQNTQ